MSCEPRNDAVSDRQAASPDHFARTSSTWLAYLLVGYFMYVQASLASLLLMSAQAALSDLHGEWRAAAISEANVAAGAAAILAPVLVGAFSRTEVPGWRGALLFAAVLLTAIAAALGRAPVPGAKPGPAMGSPDRRVRGDGGGGRRVLPAVFWGWCAVLFFCTAVEWGVAYWGTSFLEGEAGLEAAHAATLMGAYFVALLVGRVVGSRLARKVRPEKLLVGAVILSAAGFLPFWLAPWFHPSYSPRRSQASRASSSRASVSATSTLWAPP